MSADKFLEDLRNARRELDAATTEVMVLVRDNKAFGKQWHDAIARERHAHQTLRWLMDSPVIHGENRPTARQRVNQQSNLA